MKRLGYCVGILKPDEVIFTSEEPVSLGEFVIIESEEMEWGEGEDIGDSHIR